MLVVAVEESIVLVWAAPLELVKLVEVMVGVDTELTLMI
jgi:hypothetical protein